MKYNSEENEFGQRVRQLRGALSLTQKEFREKIESAVNISEIEAGQTKPGLVFIKKVLKTFNVDANWLFSGQGNMFVHKENDNLHNYDFGDQHDDIMDMLKLFSKSPLTKITVMAYAKQFILGNNEIIKKDITITSEKTRRQEQ